MASLLELLISRRVIAPEQARDAAGLAEETGAFIGRILVAQGAVAEDYLAKFLADECSVRMPEGKLEADGDLIHLLPERLMKRYRMVPLRRDSRGVLSIAVAEPLSIGGLDQVKRRLGMAMKLVLVKADTIDRLIAAGQVGEEITSLSQPSEEAQEDPSMEGEQEQDRLAEQVVQAFSEKPSAAIEGMSKDVVEEPVVTKKRDSLRAAKERTRMPEGWRPEQVLEELPQGLLGTFEQLVAAVQGRGQIFVVLVGPDVARDQVLRKLYWTTWAEEDAGYLDIIAFNYPDDPLSVSPSVLVIDGVDSVPDAHVVEEQEIILRDISKAYSSRVPLVVGLRSLPRDSDSLSSGLKLTLGLGKILILEGEDASEVPDTLDVSFSKLLEETILWSEGAFPGAGLKPLLAAVKQVYDKGNRSEALGKAGAAVSSRVSHLSSLE